MSDEDGHAGDPCPSVADTRLVPIPEEQTVPQRVAPASTAAAAEASPRRAMTRKDLWAAFRRRGPFLALVLISFVFRLPRFLNAADFNADYGIIGLQAMHVLRGEHSLHVWGATYQSSLEPILLAALFAIFGPKPVLLLVEPFLAFLVQLAVVHDLLARRVSRTAAFFGALVLAVAPWSATWLSLYGPRQLSVAMVFVGIWLLDRAGSRAQPRPSAYVLGAFVTVSAAYVDVLALQLFPAVLLFAVLCAFDKARAPRALARGVMLALGIAAGYVVLRVGHAGDTPGGGGCLSANNVPNNASVLWDQCLPAALALKVYMPGAELYPTLWEPPTWFAFIQLVGAAMVGLAYAGAYASSFTRVPWAVRRLAALSFVAVVACLTSFLVACRVGDMWAMRYLAPITWFLPFALAPAMWLFPRMTPALLAPYLVSSLVGGWIANGPAVRGPKIVVTARGSGEDEHWLAEALRKRGVHHAAAQYFLSYRLSFLWQEDPLVVPIEHGADKYAPHRAAFDAASVGAYVFHSSEPRAQPETYEALLRAQHVPFEREKIAGFTVLIFHRR